VPLQTSQVFLTAIYCFQVSKSTVEDPRDSRRICSNGPLLQQVDARYLPIYLSSKLSSAFAQAPSVKKGLAPVFSFLLPTKTIILETFAPAGESIRNVNHHFAPWWNGASSAGMSYSRFCIVRRLFKYFSRYILSEKIFLVKAEWSEMKILYLWQYLSWLWWIIL